MGILHVNNQMKDYEVGDSIHGHSQECPAQAQRMVLTENAF